MQDAVIVSTARTPIAKAFRGAFNDLKSPSMAAVALRAAVERAGIEPGEIEDVVMGTAMQGGTAAINLARLSTIAAGLPLSVSGQTIDRQCASCLMAFSIAAKQIMVDGMQVTVGAGQEQISLVQNTHMKWSGADFDPNVVKMSEHAYMPMLQTAEIVAKRYNISREAQDEYGFLSQQRTAAAQAAGLFANEIVPVTATKKLVDKESGAVS
ncbi:MAG: acetyl-CoA C-acyltransferase, partial [Paracoccus sp. (in: a-proteobacteria)]